MGRKRKQEGGSGSAVPSNSKSSKLVGSSSSAGRTAARGGAGGWPRSGHVAPSSDPVQGFSGQLHPLLNPVVLSNLFSFCPRELLATCRLVCKTWRDDSRPAWRSSATPKITYSVDVERICLAVGKDSSNMSLTEFLDSWRNGFGGQSRQSIHLEVREFDFGVRIGASVPRRGSPAEQMLELVGRSVKKLNLVNCIFGNVAAFRQVIYQSFPNLQSLVLDHPEEIPEGLPEQQPVNNRARLIPAHGGHRHLKSVSICSPPSMSVPVSWVEFLSHFPALTTVGLSFSTGSYHSPPEFRRFERNLGLFLDAVTNIIILFSTN